MVCIRDGDHVSFLFLSSREDDASQLGIKVMVSLKCLFTHTTKRPSFLLSLHSRPRIPFLHPIVTVLWRRGGDNGKKSLSWPVSKY